ncbi:hypothetical protein OQA88_3266 [Cercophora sp. LCS_1]
MAFNFAGNAIAGANSPFLDAFKPNPVAARSNRFTKPIVARNDSDVPTVNMFVDGADEDMKYVASIVDVCTDKTTFALRCTSGPAYLPSGACGSNGLEVTLTSGPAIYQFSTFTETRVGGTPVTATVQETCALEGTTRAACTATIGGNVQGTSTTVSVSTTYTGARVYKYDVTITGGAEKTASPKPTCAAAPSGNGNGGGSGSGTGSQSGASVKGVAVWGLVGLVGVVSAFGL